MAIPEDIRKVTLYNGVPWVHEYQEACVDRIVRFIDGDDNRIPLIDRWKAGREPPLIRRRSTSANFDQYRYFIDSGKI
jgi:hypothetical protein